MNQPLHAQHKTARAVITLLDQQSSAWNAGNLAGFMEGYWRSDSLLFLGKSGPTYGWAATLANYQKGYPDTASMGKLRFELLRIESLEKNHAFVVGKWFLTRRMGNLQGAFSLILRKIRGQWVIVADHSS
jgi:ketosteroid isomerase-like protein